MASLARTKSGRWYVQFNDKRDLRRTVNIGPLPKASAEKFRGHIAALVVAAMSNTVADRQTAIWVRGLSDKLFAKLAAFDLVRPRAETAVPEMAAVWDAYLARRTDLKPNTIKNLKQVRNEQVGHFGARRDIRTINKGEAADWGRSVKSRLAAATAAMHVKKARQIFDDAVSRNLIPSNPFRAVKAGSQSNPERMVYVAPAAIDAVIDACPDAEWKLIFALARYGGLRVPSESNALRWGDVDWQAGRITVHAPKTGKRVIPLFHELRPYLEAARVGTPDPKDRVIERLRGENLRTTGEKIVAKAEVASWGKLFQNLRASRETDLLDHFPIQAVCQWIGNSEAVARKHYLMVKDSHFDRAVHGAASTNLVVNDGAVVAVQLSKETRVDEEVLPSLSDGLWSTARAAKFCDCSQDKIERWIRDGKLPAYNIGDGKVQYRVARADVIAFVAGLRVGSHRAPPIVLSDRLPFR